VAAPYCASLPLGAENKKFRSDKIYIQDFSQKTVTESDQQRDEDIDRGRIN
jgi:hypothetical protein